MALLGGGQRSRASMNRRRITGQGLCRPVGQLSALGQPWVALESQLRGVVPTLPALGLDSGKADTPSQGSSVFPLPLGASLESLQTPPGSLSPSTLGSATACLPGIWGFQGLPRGQFTPGLTHGPGCHL